MSSRLDVNRIEHKLLFFALVFSRFTFLLSSGWCGHTEPLRLCFIIVILEQQPSFSDQMIQTNSSTCFVFHCCSNIWSANRMSATPRRRVKATCWSRGRREEKWGQIKLVAWTRRWVRCSWQSSRCDGDVFMNSDDLWVMVTQNLIEFLARGAAVALKNRRSTAW